MADDNVIRFPQIERLDELDAELQKLHERLGCKQLCHYTLVDREPVEVETLKAWVYEVARRKRIAVETGVDPWRVGLAEIAEVAISTVFIGLDQDFLRRGPPLLFETMIFGGRLDHSRNRCAMWAEAEAMHAEAVPLVRADHLRVVK
jgi:hypothetical protein